jgi:hypothetical protein
MIEQVISKLINIIDVAPKILEQISEEEMSEKPSKNKWSKKEILGHLIDSAIHNHQRIIRGQFENIPEINYDQNKWNEYNFYQQLDSKQIIMFWTIYNKHLIEIIKRIPKDNIQKQIKVNENLFAIELIIIDYLKHLEHHLKQVINY